MTSTTENAANVSIMLLIDQRFCITPPYRTTSPGTLMNPTSVAAVICHAVSPGLSHDGASRGMHLLRLVDAGPRRERRLDQNRSQVDSRQTRQRRAPQP